MTARYDLSGTASYAGGLALDAKNHILFSYLHRPSSMAVIVNADTGKVITTLPTGEGVLHWPPVLITWWTDLA